MTPLHHIGEALRQALLHVPLGFVRALFVALLVGLAIWVACLPRAQTTPDGAKPKLSQNLKMWTAITLGIQVVIYLLL
ncbi:MAG: hypothetical protein RIQ93_1181 [Verrucomicrobiota bacterium]|jgi:hypothetical protein